MIIIHDKRLPVQYREALGDLFEGADLFPFEPDIPGKQGVYGSILCHPDIYFFQINRTALVYAPVVSKKDIDSLCDRGVTMIKGEKVPDGYYPETAWYNAAGVGDVVFHKLCCTDPVILEETRKIRMRHVDVHQGYTRCSVLSVKDRAIITFDRGIDEAADQAGIDTLLVSPGYIVLPGEKHGFIGGTGGSTPDGKVVILGDIGTHPEGDRIISFFDKHNVEYIDIKGMPLYDAGGLIILDV